MPCESLDVKLDTLEHNSGVRKIRVGGGGGGRRAL